MELSHHVHQHIQRSWDLYLYDNAIFLSERLYAESPSLQNLYFVANSYFLSGDHGTTYRMLRTLAPFDSSDYVAYTQVMYVFGVSQVKLGRFAEAERTFQDMLGYGEPAPTTMAAVQYWLGQSQRGVGKSPAALNSFKSAVQKDPSLFIAFEAAVIQNAQDVPNPYEDTVPGTAPGGHPSSKPSTAPAGPGGKKSVPTSTTPSTSTLQPTIKRTMSGVGTNTRPATATTTNNNASTPTTSTGPRKTFCPEPPQSDVMVPPPTGTSVPGTATAGGASPLKKLLRHFATAAKLLWSFRCVDAIAYLTGPEFPGRQKGTGWYLSTLARSFYENGNNIDATTQWAMFRRKEPWKITHTLVYYSTALWHLRKERELSVLAQQLIESDPHSSTTLCVTGNFYSLIKDQTQALKMLQRATQVEKSFSYAHTLKGYEHLSLDECSEAEACFLVALKCDPRNYTAIGGLGEVNTRQGHHMTARQHYQRALDINPFPTLFARLACVLQEEGSPESMAHALSLFDAAIQRDPQNVMMRHRRAELYMKLSRPDDALPDLEFLRLKCPKEASVFITLARCHRKLGNKQQALFYYNSALDLDDAWSAKAKVAIDRLAEDESSGIDSDTD